VIAFIIAVIFLGNRQLPAALPIIVIVGLLAASLPYSFALGLLVGMMLYYFDQKIPLGILSN